MSNLNRHVKSDRIKWIATSVALLLVAIVLVGVCLQVFGKGKQKPSEWFKKDKTEQTAPADDENDEGMIVTPEETNSKMRMNAARSSTDPSSYTLSVTYTPSYALQPTLSWTAKFADPDSAWANGKTVTDYVTVFAQGTTTATVTCKEAFGEQVIVTAALKDKPDVSATCTVDYKARYIGTSTSLHVYKTATLQLDLSTTHGDTGMIYAPLDSDYTAVSYPSLSSTFYVHEFVPVVTVGTIGCTLDNLEYYVKVSSGFASHIAMSTKMVSDCNLTCSSDWVFLGDDYCFFEEGFTLSSIQIKQDTAIKFVDGLDRTSFHVSTFFRTLCPEIANTSGDLDVKQWGYFRNAAKSYTSNPLHSGDEYYHFDVKIVATVDGETYTDLHKVKLTNIAVPSANSLSIDQSALTF